MCKTEPAYNEMNDKYFLKKNFNIPLLNVNQTNIHEHKSGNLGNHPSEKISSSFTAGFKSERIHHKIDPDIIIRQKDARELPEIKKENKDSSGINFFFYKNLFSAWYAQGKHPLFLSFLE